MDPKAVLDTRVKPKLVDLFGDAMANQIITGSTKKAGAIPASLDEAGFRKLVEAIGADPKFTGMVGKKAAITVLAWKGDLAK